MLEWVSVKALCLPGCPQSLPVLLQSTSGTLAWEFMEVNACRQDTSVENKSVIPEETAKKNFKHLQYYMQITYTNIQNGCVQFWILVDLLQNLWKSVCISFLEFRKILPFSVPTAITLSSCTVTQATSAFSLDMAEHCKHNSQVIHHQNAA